MKTSVPGTRALRFERYCRVDTDTGVSFSRPCPRQLRTILTHLQASDGVDKAVDAFFGAGDTGVKGVLEGFKSVVKTGLQAILGDTSAGESYDKKFFVCIKQFVLLRVTRPSQSLMISAMPSFELICTPTNTISATKVSSPTIRTSWRTFSASRSSIIGMLPLMSSSIWLPNSLVMVTLVPTADSSCISIAS
jgi:hypothetical protein